MQPLLAARWAARAADVFWQATAAAGWPATLAPLAAAAQRSVQHGPPVQQPWRGFAAAAPLPATHSTTILCVRRGREVVIIGDGQATQGDFIVKPNVRKVRRIGATAVGGFAGVAVDGLALLERLEAKLEEHPGQLQRAAVELAKMWRQDKLLRELDASLIVADAEATLWLMGNGDVLEAGPDGVISIGSGADFAESAARALLQVHRSREPAGDAAAANSGQSCDPPSSSSSWSLFDVAQTAMRIAADSCVYTNATFSWHHILPDGTIASGPDSSSSSGALERPAGADSTSTSSSTSSSTGAQSDSD